MQSSTGREVGNRTGLSSGSEILVWVSLSCETGGFLGSQKMHETQRKRYLICAVM